MRQPMCYLLTLFSAMMVAASSIAADADAADADSRVCSAVMAVKSTGMLQKATSVLSQSSLAVNATTAITAATPRSAPSFAVFVRVIRQEMPYLLSFVSHYTSLGVRNFYLLSNVEEDLGAIRAYLESQPHSQSELLNASFAYLAREGGADDILWSDGLVEAIKEDYVVLVDTDEYLTLPTGVLTLPQLAEEQPADLWSARWGMATNDNFEPLKPPYRVYMARGRRVEKWIVRTSILKNLRGIHNPEVVPGYHKIVHLSSPLVHFWSRDFSDVVTKGVAQFFRDGSQFKVYNDTSGPFHGCEGLNRTIKLLEDGDLPERLKLLALMSQHPLTQTVEAPGTLISVDRDVQQELQRQLLNETAATIGGLLPRLHVAYKRFRACLTPIVAEQPDKLDLSDIEAQSWLETLPCSAG